MDTWQGNNLDPVTLHRYLYANVDPVNSVDPTGNYTMAQVGAGLAIAGGLATLSYVALNSYFNSFDSDDGLSNREYGLLALTGQSGERLPGLLSINSDDISQISGQETGSNVKATASTVPVDGQPVYRVWGGCAREYGASWTPLDPRLGGMNYRNLAGLPFCNAGTFLSEGILRTATNITVFPGVALDGNIGGWPEYVIPNPLGQVNIIQRYFVEPSF